MAAGCCGMAAGCCGAAIIPGMAAGMMTCGTRQSSSCADPRSSSTSAGVARRGGGESGGRGGRPGAVRERGGRLGAACGSAAKARRYVTAAPAGVAMQRGSSTQAAAAALTLADKGHLAHVLAEAHLRPGVVPAAGTQSCWWRGDSGHGLRGHSLHAPPAHVRRAHLRM